MEPWVLNIQEWSSWSPDPYLWKNDRWGASSTEIQRVCVHHQLIIPVLDQAIFSLKFIIVSIVDITSQQVTSCPPIRPVINAWYMNPSSLLWVKVYVFNFFGGISTQAWVAIQRAISFDSNCHEYLFLLFSSESRYPSLDDSIYLVAWLWFHPHFEGVVINFVLCNS